MPAALDLARGIVASYVSDLVRDRARIPMWGLLTGGIAALVIAALIGGWFGVFLGVLAVVAIGFSVVVFVIRWLALRSIARLAPPIPDHREQVEAAMAKADLPTGPLSLVRLLYRLRRGGVDDEIERLQQVVSDLADGLEPEAD